MLVPRRRECGGVGRCWIKCREKLMRKSRVPFRMVQLIHDNEITESAADRVGRVRHSDGVVLVPVVVVMVGGGFVVGGGV